MPAASDVCNAVNRTQIDTSAMTETQVNIQLWCDDPLLLASTPSNSWSLFAWSPLWKGVLELGIAFALLILSLPVLIISAILIRLTSRGPVVYSQTRLGRNGKPFKVLKLRTMFHNCERHTGARWAQPNDPRVTTIGRFLRRTHLDELPQLWNVLRGEMSLVGPRPERPEFVPELERMIPHYRVRLLVRPGVTGLAQVQLPADTDVTSVRRKLAYDLYYIRNGGFWLDMKLMVCTFAKMIGLPFHIISRMFVMPPRDRVEDAYVAWQTAPATANLPSA
jgi:lipopolysaccharide/colanic/teichoic acid biosynthesis glycosyltransferase